MADLPLMLREILGAHIARAPDMRLVGNSSADELRDRRVDADVIITGDLGPNARSEIAAWVMPSRHPPLVFRIRRETSDTVTYEVVLAETVLGDLAPAAILDAIRERTSRIAAERGR